ncbi:hypothetical protein HBI56_069800 [Parastagonospora nodorum]|nr:hypothetical protein HBH49_094030 [Parastagonospora nodorum]KAH4190565.1 hypothetical protein HBH42_130640 [Parastagonospora nodorum]KAH4468002.1 hypothetical protein HBH91_004190 [Parastagonospora nodorum]KAH4502324.1 hypothetical protein HBH89_106680 [Parastagonospora nodorum]KAH4535671.1 hypothetical protein HBH85_157460 [Parastagonospora nodorum]
MMLFRTDRLYASMKQPNMDATVNLTSSKSISTNINVKSINRTDPTRPSHHHYPSTSHPPMPAISVLFPLPTPSTPSLPSNPPPHAPFHTQTSP